MSGTIADKVKSLGHDLPEVSSPAGSYVSHNKIGNMLFVAGQIPVAGGNGRVGGELSAEQGAKAAQSAALALIAQIDAAVDGDLAKVRNIARLGVFVAATSDFTQYPAVGNGASDLLVDVFGDAGRHVRTAVGVASLPRGVCVEIDAIVEVAGS